MSIVKYKSKNGSCYAYVSIPRWDPVRKQSRPVRIYLGKVDPESGNIIETSGRRKKLQPNQQLSQEIQDDTSHVLAEKQAPESGIYYKELQRLKQEVRELKQELMQLKQRNSLLEDIVAKVGSQLDRA